MTNPTPLSPAAQAVLDAYKDASDGDYINGEWRRLPPMTDLHDLITRMADELDHYRQLLTDDRREVHSLAAEARAALSASMTDSPNWKWSLSTCWTGSSVRP